LRAFHTKHFATAPIPAQFFVQPEAETINDDAEEYDEENDGLGYYEDGVQRTLTDEQIALFRHTEIQMILRERRRKRDAEEFSEGEATPEPDAGKPSEIDHEPEDGEVPSTPSYRPSATAPSTKNGPHNKVQTGRVEKQSQWKTTNAKQQRKNARSRKANREKKKIEKKKHHNGSAVSGQAEDDGESDEWDPWHQANGPDNQKDNTVDLDY
jgi:hypothetical protein